MTIPTDLVPASPSARSWAYLVDATLAAILTGALCGWIDNLYIAGILAWVIPAAYYVLQQSSPAGATLGQRLLKIRVGNIFGEKLSVGRALLRHVAFTLPFLPLTLFELTPGYIHSMEQASGLLELLGNPEQMLEHAEGLITPAAKMDMALTGLAGFLSVIFVLPMFVRRDKAAIYDLLSDTRVVKSTDLTSAAG